MPAANRAADHRVGACWGTAFNRPANHVAEPVHGGSFRVTLLSMQSKATTVKAYLAELTPDRKEAVAAVRKVILAAIDDDIEEGMASGMIVYSIPHRVFPAGYHCDPKSPLPYAAVASQKQHLSIYLMGVYVGCDGGGASELSEWFRTEWLKTGKRLDMGQCCVRFKKLEDVPLELVGEAIRRMPSKQYIREYEAAMATMGRMKAAKAKPAAKAPAKGPALSAKKPPAKAKAARPAKKKVAKKA